MNKIYCSFLICLMSSSLFATHNRAGEILYKRIAPFVSGTGAATVAVYTYSFTLIKYTDFGVSVAYDCTDTLNFGDGSKSVVSRINGTNSGCCPNGITCGQLIVNTANYKVNKSMYSAVHQYSAPGTYYVFCLNRNRNAGVINISNSVNQAFYVESALIIYPNAEPNSSPELTYPPIDKAYTGLCFYHNPNAIDADGDSLIYQLAPCQSAFNQQVTGYSYPTFSNYFFINGYTGLLNWCTPIQSGEYNVALKVFEWRKASANAPAKLMGYVLRDMQIMVDYFVVGLGEREQSESTSVYPNPVSDKLKIAFADNALITMHNASGAMVYSGNASTNCEINTQEFTNGIYIITIETARGRQYKKISVQH